MLKQSGGSLEGVRVGIPAEFWGEGLQPEVSEAVRAAIHQLRRLGAELREVTLPHTPYALAAYYIIAPAEASSNLARYDGMKYGYRAPGNLNSIDSMLATRDFAFGPEVKRRIMLGTYALSAGYYDAYYKKAQQVRTLIARDYTQAFEEVDVLVGPTCPSVAFALGSKVDRPSGDVPERRLYRARKPRRYSRCVDTVRVRQRTANWPPNPRQTL